MDRCARQAWLGTILFLGALLTSLPASGSVVLAQVASGIGSPTDIQNARDGSGRLFFVQQTGQIMVWKNGVVLPTAFLDISGLIRAGGEQGLLGLAFHPNYRNNGFFYVKYNRSLDGATVVARYSRSAANPDVADPLSGTVLLTAAQPFANHNGGAVRFGPDGYLYIAAGDGGGGNDPLNSGQNLTSLLGKLLRIDVNTTTGVLPYGIPPDNPFAGSPQPGVRAEIWAYGLRNPFRFSFDRVAGDLFIGDVGQGAREEIDFVRAGSAGGMNFGWRVMEGTLCTNLPGDPPCNPSSFTPPIFDYDHGQGCSVIGGYLYRGHAVPELIPTSPPALGQLFNGVYVYGDFCSGTIWRLNATAAGGVSNSVLLASGLSITTFGEDENGEIYVADAGTGKIYKFVSTVPGSGAPARFIPVSPCRVVDTRSPGVYPISGGGMASGESRSFALPFSACGIPSNALAYSLNATVVPNGPLGFLAMWPTGQSQPLVSTLNSPDGRIKANAAIVPAGTGGAVSAHVTNSTDLILDIDGYFVAAGSGGDLAFYPLSPCRLSDTRFPPGPNAGPTMGAGQTRTLSTWNLCGIPSGAQALSLNYTVVPQGPLGFLTTWPAGQAQPLVSTLNAPTGTVVANAAIVPTGTGGQINVVVTNTTDVIIDVNGYFAPTGSPGALSFFAATPCRVSDTRNPAGSFGGPQMVGGSTRSYAVPGSACGIPSSAQAYSLSATVVPSGLLGYLSFWPTGISQPLVSTLNAWDGAVTSNAALVPAGTSGGINAFVTNSTDLILDINGYFAP